MFMMTTEEETRSNQHCRNIFSNFDSQKALEYNQRNDCIKVRGGKHFSGESLTIPKTYKPSKPTIGGCDKLSPSSDKSFHHDDGYSTDSKSNTSPSTTSPLSSSFSSLSTLDGSFHSHMPSGVAYTGPSNANHTAMHANAQRGPIQKLSVIQGNGKIHVNRHALVTAKKKDIPQELQDSPANLEDRLRALTTIEEEEPALSNVLGKETSRKTIENTQHRVDRSGHNQVFNSNSGRVNVETQGQESSSGFFHAVPVEIMAPQYSHDQGGPGENLNDNFTNFGSTNSELIDGSFPVSPSPAQETNEKKWHDYRRYFEKDCDIPLHNIDTSSRGKFVHNGLDNSIPVKNINRQLGTTTSAVQEEQLDRQMPSQIRQNEMGRNLADRRLDDNGFNGNPDLTATNHQPPFHGYQVGQHNPWNSEAISPAMSDSRLLSSLPQNVHQPSFNRNEDSHFPNGQHPYQYDDRNSVPHPHHHYQHHHHHQQQQQHQRQQQQQQQPCPNHQEHYHQHYQHPQYNDVHNSNHLPQQLIEGRGVSPQNWPSQNHSSKSNSLPRHYDQLRQHPMFYTENQQDLEDEVVLRRSWASPSSRPIPDRAERHSMPPDSRSQHLLECQKLNSMGAERYSLDLGNIPQLQKQIRATSEMCLQASKRHVFASSADIYKLFQGQKKPATPPSSNQTNDFVRNRDNAHRHSFHSTPNGSWIKSNQGLQQDQLLSPRDNLMSSINAKHVPLSSYQPSSYRIPASPGPLRADHSIPLPQTAFVNNHFLSPTSSSSILPLSLSEIPHIQRQSSGYSSENELQQIEQNAKASKRAKEHYMGQGVINPDQEFVPVDPTLDQDSSSSLPESEPVYVNQPMLASARASSDQNKSSPLQQLPDYQAPPPPLPPRPKRQPSPSTGQSNHRITPDIQNKQNNTSGHTPLLTRQHSSPTSVAITQHQVINFNRKSLTIKSYVPSLSYSNANDPNGQNADNASGLVGGHILSLTQPEFQASDENVRGSNSAKSQRLSGSPCPLTPLEVAQALDVPFATSVISDESGDRLSTLV